jgi:hypothetical protein
VSIALTGLAIANTEARTLEVSTLDEKKRQAWRKEGRKGYLKGGKDYMKERLYKDGLYEGRPSFRHHHGC